MYLGWPTACSATAPMCASLLTHWCDAALDGAGISYRIVYGSGTLRLDNALFAINSAATCGGIKNAQAIRSENVTSRPWACEKCSDPDCEHKLFSGLLRG